MPAVQPAELWQESGRWEQYGPELLRLRDRHQREFCFGPTHEEIITDLARNELKSYKQLPINFYQIQTKFRDEIRPRFGVMRAREFLMKDAYSFHLDDASLAETYRQMHETYCRIFTRCGLDFRPVQADTGSIGGNASHEFHVLAASGEDAIAFSTAQRLCRQRRAGRGRGAGRRPARAGRGGAPGRHPQGPHHRRPGRAVRPADRAHGQDPGRRRVRGKRRGLVALLVRGDHELNAIKAEKLPQVAAPLRMATEDEIRAAIGAGPGSLGPEGPAHPLHRRPHRRRHRRLQRRRQSGRQALVRPQLGPRPAAARGRRSAQRGRGRPQPGRPGHAHHRARHRGRSHLPARAQVQRGHEDHRARRGRQGRPR